MSREDEEQQREKNAKEMGKFMTQLEGAERSETPEQAGAGMENDARGPAEDDVTAGDESGAATAPQTEAEAEAMQARSDLLSDRVEARMRTEGEEADYERILEEEIERMRRERDEPEPTEEQLKRNAEWIDEMNRAVEEALANPNFAELERSEREHPLAGSVFALSAGLHRLAEAENWIPVDATQEHPAAELVNATSSAGAKLAGALNGYDWPPVLDFCAGVIARLKRARSYLEDALSAVECCREQRLIAESRLDGIAAKLRTFAEATDALTWELRARLKRGRE